MNLDFMSQINGPVILVFHGREHTFKNGAAALEVYSDEKFEATEVFREENAVRVTIVDKTEVREPNINGKETYPDICISCGAPVPEGQMVCWKCQHEFDAGGVGMRKRIRRKRSHRFE